MWNYKIEDTSRKINNFFPNLFHTPARINPRFLHAWVNIRSNRFAGKIVRLISHLPIEERREKSRKEGGAFLGGKWKPKIRGGREKGATHVRYTVTYPGKEANCRWGTGSMRSNYQIELIELIDSSGLMNRTRWPTVLLAFSWKLYSTIRDLKS